jgi:hypothetical protein
MVKMSIHLTDGNRHVQYISENTMRDIIDHIQIQEYLTFHDAQSKSLYNMSHVTKIQFDEQVRVDNHA